MARKLILENLMKLARGIGANPSKFMGTKTNITFLGKGPIKNPLFNQQLNLNLSHPRDLYYTSTFKGARDSVIEATEEAMGYATANKLNDIQLKILTENLSGLNKIYNPPPLPTASVTDMATRTRNLTTEGLGALRAKTGDTPLTLTQPRSYKGGPRPFEKGVMLDRKGNPIQDTEWANRMTRSSLPEPGPREIEAYRGVLDQQTGMSRAIARNLLLKDTRLKLSPEDLSMLKEGKGEPLDMMVKYYGESIHLYDDFLNSVNVEAARPDEFAEMILKNVKLIPQFAKGGLARILEV